MTFREGDKMLSQAVAVNPTDVAAFKQLLDKDVYKRQYLGSPLEYVQ